MLIKRREFLQLGSLATASMMLPKFLKAFEKTSAVPPGNKVLVILQLSGGNDGLNTVIPYSNDLYYSSRPRIGIRKDKSLILTDDAALNPSLPFIEKLFHDGKVGILNGVGYPNPDRSHFRSMDIWQTASRSDEYLNTGWVGRYLDAQCRGCETPTQAMEIDDVLSLALKGHDIKGIAMKDPRRLYNTSHEKFYKDLLSDHTYESHEQPVDYLYKTMATTLSSAEYIFQQSRLHPTKNAYPSTQLAQQLRTIASLIFSDINTKVYYVSLGSFDTHVAQDAQQRRLFTELNDALAAFVNDLTSNNRFEDVMIATFSEFGRRVSENASGGTDHGTANNMFFVSGGLRRAGLLNALPDLAHLEEGDLNHTVDFRSVYATLIKDWLGADDREILGQQFPHLDFI